MTWTAGLEEVGAFCARCKQYVPVSWEVRKDSTPHVLVVARAGDGTHTVELVIRPHGFMVSIRHRG